MTSPYVVPHDPPDPIVVVTGTDIRHVNLDECAAVLRKPIAAEQLVGAVEHALGSARGRSD